jgi:hypothetical protein
MGLSSAQYKKNCENRKIGIFNDIHEGKKIKSHNYIVPNSL